MEPSCSPLLFPSCPTARPLQPRNTTRDPNCVRESDSTLEDNTQLTTSDLQGEPWQAVRMRSGLARWPQQVNYFEWDKKNKIMYSICNIYI